jgi:hypothetical protein
MTNRKPFDLQKALAGDPVETRDGREIKVVFVSEMNEEYPVLCVYKDIDFEYTSRWYKKDGKEYSNRESNLDLFMLTKKKALWIAVSKEPYAPTATELLQLLPAWINNYDLIIKKCVNEYEVKYCNPDDSKRLAIEFDSNIANALAKMRIYLLENNLITIED